MLFFNLLSIPFVFALQKGGTNVVVEVDNHLAGKYPLNKNQMISVKGELGITKIEIKDDRVRIFQSPCPHKIGIKMGWVRHSGKIVACVPNKVVIRVTGNENDGLDAIVG